MSHDFSNEQLKKAILDRHAVREYEDKPLKDEDKKALENIINECNTQSGLHFQLITDDPDAFDAKQLAYGKFSGLKNYIAIIGKDSLLLEETCGYYGEKIVLAAQILGLNTCWVGITYKRMIKRMVIDEGERLVLVIGVGYGKNNGEQHKSKSFESVSRIPSGMDIPDWFKNGVDAALLGPSSINQQRYKFILEDDNCVTANPGRAYFCKVDLGIAKYHFEIGAGTESFKWHE